MVDYITSAYTGIPLTRILFRIIYANNGLCHHLLKLVMVLKHYKLFAARDIGSGMTNCCEFRWISVVNYLVFSFSLLF